jgi:hypothetical protein
MTTTSWQGAFCTSIGGIGVRDRLHPGLADLLHRPAHADRIDPRRGADGADRHRHVVAAPGTVDDVSEQEGAALCFGEPALELPAHQRVQFAVLVDRPVDAGDEPRRLEPRQVLLEIARRSGFNRLLLQGHRFVEHRPGSVPRTGPRS